MKKIIGIFMLAFMFAMPSVWAAEPASANTGVDAHPYTGKAPKLNKAQVDSYLAEPDEVVFIDVRRPDEISKIGGFPVYLSIQSKELEKHLKAIPDDKKIVTVSNHAGRAGKAADLLLDKGFDVVGAVGVQDYEAEGGVLTKIEIPAPKN